MSYKFHVITNNIPTRTFEYGYMTTDVMAICPATPLTGTEKQTEWAQSIRATMFGYLAVSAEVIYKDVCTKADEGKIGVLEMLDGQACVAAAYNEVWAKLASITDARTWINEYKDSGFSTARELMMKAVVAEYKKDK